MERFDVFVGVDWASAEHAMCMLDSAGGRLHRMLVDHTQEGLDRLIDVLGQRGDRARVAVAIERPDGVLVDRLLEAGHPVVPVEPAVIRTFRSAEIPSGAKSDVADAETIAEYLRLTAARVTPLRPFSEHTRALRHTTQPPPTPRKVEGEVVGVDVGLKHLATLSQPVDGLTDERGHVPNPRVLAQHLVKLEKLNRAIARCEKDSNNRRRLGRALADVALGKLKQMISYKTNEYGHQMVEADRWFPSSKRCSDCGAVKAKLPLSQRRFDCFSCDCRWAAL